MFRTEDVEFMRFNRTENERTYGYLEARLFGRFMVIFPVIQRRDGDVYVANPSKSVHIMGRWVPCETAYFEKKEDRTQFEAMAKDFVLSQTDRNGPSLHQNEAGATQGRFSQKNAPQGQQMSPPNFGQNMGGDFKWAFQPAG